MPCHEQWKYRPCTCTPPGSSTLTLSITRNSIPSSLNSTDSNTFLTLFLCASNRSCEILCIPKLNRAQTGKRTMYAESSQPNGRQAKEPLEEKQDAARPPLHCANCDIEILWTPTIVQRKAYCCTGCAAGGPCNCDYSLYRSVNISGVIHYLKRD
jgi:hypothetical protein